jgi:hypothetical protein
MFFTCEVYYVLRMTISPSKQYVIFTGDSQKGYGEVTGWLAEHQRTKVALKSPEPFFAQFRK